MLTYFLQVNLCWLMFYGLYWALLSRETFFKLNRIYLIISLLCGLIVPFATEYMSQMEEIVAMPIVQISQPMAQSIEAFQENIEVNMVITAETWNLWQILRGCYVVGVLWVLMRFLMGLLKIWKLYQRGFKEKNNDFTLVHCEGLQTPFSFFKWIFIDKTLYDAAVLGQILEHEKAHVHQKHSFDIVGIEILRGMFWLSPLVHLYARSLRNVHEYLADAAVLQNTEKKQYGRLLINQSANTSGLIIANHFNFSQLKKRIIMMSRNRSERKALVKYTLAGPLFITLMVSFISPKSGLMTKSIELSSEISDKISDIENKIKETPINPTVKSNILNSVLQNSLPANLIVKIENGGSGGLMNIENFKKQNALNVTQFMQEPNVQWRIKEFSVQRVSKLGVSNSIRNQGNTFNSDVKTLINQAETGDIFHFMDIIISSSADNRLGNWGSINFTLSDAFSYGIPTLSTGKMNGLISKRNIQIASLGGLILKDSKKFRIYSFKMNRLSSDKNETSSVENNGASFSDDSKKLMNTLEEGDNLIIDNIKVVDSEGKIIGINDKMSFTVGSVDVKNKVPQPFPTLNGYRGGIDLNRFKELDELLPYEENTFGYFEAISKNIGEIESFTVRKNDEDAISCIGSRFSNKVQDLTQNSKKGDVLRFENIIFKMNSGAKLKWNIGELIVGIKKQSVYEWSTRAEWFAKPYAPTHVLNEIPTDAELISCIINHYPKYPKGESKSPQKVNFSGYAWTEEALQLLQKAEIGDMYEFTNIKVKRRGQTNIEDFNAIRYRLN